MLAAEQSHSQQTLCAPEPGSSKKTRRIKIADRFQWKCYWCSQTLRHEMGYQNSATIEHLVPRCQGGSNLLKNLAAACHRCNWHRGVQSEAEFALVARKFAADRRSVEQAKLAYRAGKSCSPGKFRYRRDKTAAKQAYLLGDASMLDPRGRPYRLYLHMVRTKGPPPVSQQSQPAPSRGVLCYIKGLITGWNKLLTAWA